MSISENEIYESTIKNKNKSIKHLKLELWTLTLNTIILISSIVATVFVYNFKIPPEIIPVSANGSYFEKVPLDLPNKTDIEVKQWFADRIIEAFDYNYLEQSKHTARIAIHYQPEALSSLDSFINGESVNGRIAESLLKRRVDKEAGIVQLVLADGIKLQKGKVGDIFGWQASTKGALVLYSKSGTIRLGRYEVTLVAVRADETETEDGIQIKSIQMKKIS